MDSWLCLLAIAVMKDGCFRWDDLVRVELGDVLVTWQYARVFITEGKTDKARKGFWGMVPCTRREQPWSGYALLRRAPEWLAAELARLSVVEKGAWLLAHREMSTWVDGAGSVALNKVRLLCPLQRVHGAVLPASAQVSAK